VTTKDNLHEKLSALVDDNLSELERDQLIAKIAHDDELLATWSRYHLIKDTLQGHVHDYTSRNLAASISQQLELEPVVLAPKTRKAVQWQRPLAGFAIAASVALVAVLGVRNIDSGTSITPVQVAQLEAPARVTVTPDPQPVISSQSSSPATVEFVAAGSEGNPPGARLKSYLVNHYERKSDFGMLPYVRMIGYETPSK
jgi:sigma-E factor negative regulatory protein RseA